MGRERKFKGTDAEIALARFLCEITDGVGLDTVDKVAKRFPQGGSRSKWAEYLNGAKVIPKPLLRDVLEEVRRTRPDGWNGRLLVEATKLWKAATEGTAPPQDSAGSELVSLYRRLTETTQALNKAQAVAANSDRVIPLLLQFAGRQEMKVAELTHQVEHLRERERAQAAHRLEQAQFRLARIQAELEQARSHRFSAEQAQAALMREQQEALKEIERLQHAAADPGPAEPASLPERAPEPRMSDEEFDRGMDEQLDLIGTDREQRRTMLSEVLEQAGMEPDPPSDGPRTIPGTVLTDHTPQHGPAARQASPAPSETVQGLSRTTSDNPATSDDTPAQTPVGLPRQKAAQQKQASKPLDNVPTSADKEDINVGASDEHVTVASRPRAVTRNKTTGGLYRLVPRWVHAAVTSIFSLPEIESDHRFDLSGKHHPEQQMRPSGDGVDSPLSWTRLALPGPSTVYNSDLKQSDPQKCSHPINGFLNSPNAFLRWHLLTPGLLGFSNSSCPFSVKSDVVSSCAAGHNEVRTVGLRSTAVPEA
ncbi:hypothetical protein HZZ00_19125 [Streptomyces sp. NEAU-sy36]|uniref:hypothetical protein n=1 Tax=unclassified Streptomyces TaxID=2593676 RepID=UPI0015D5F85D|nr:MULTISPECIES: hypothetical protein [unclassified Streptomyces]QLJ02835.1 hypothetical protein HZZ00_18670 [Streptomyces sp. NEAU-sy36]QLJ02908.1 hypothetical protein HZZ00_19125 [Streptomyces sp. NEAU-sy36]